MQARLGRVPRLLRFVLVGALCFALQSIALLLLERVGAAPTLANTAGFALSAQINFALSAVVTWRDRPTRGVGATLARWGSYQGTALFSLLINTAVFAVTWRYVGSVLAAAAGVLTATGVTFMTCHFLIFHKGRSVTLVEPLAASERISR